METISQTNGHLIIKGLVSVIKKKKMSCHCFLRHMDKETNRS